MSDTTDYLSDEEYQPLTDEDGEVLFDTGTVAGNPSFRIVRGYVAWLEGQMPNQTQPSGMAARKAGVYYSHPGDKVSDHALVWVENIRWTVETHSLRAGVRRRQILTQFDLVIGVELQGPTDRDQLQYEAEELAHSIYQVIDLDIATEEHLHSPDLVDVARVVECEVERGMTATGAGVRMTTTVEFEARYIS